MASEIGIGPGTCKLCGGWARQLPPGGSHYLCVELTKLGQPTPSLGDRCEECKGAGHIVKGAAGPAIFLSAGPAAIARAMEAYAPRCETCEGRGVVPANTEQTKTTNTTEGER